MEEKAPLANTDELAKVLHKVNTSLSIIWGYTQLLEQSEFENEKQKAWVEKISKECKNLKELLDSYRK